MGLLKHFRSRARLKGSNDSSSNHGGGGPRATTYGAPAGLRYTGPDCTARLPAAVLANILTYVCPHAADRTYAPCESSQVGDGCMLCDLRELAHCAALCRRWRAVAESLLYTSIRIDAVHYCEREYALSEERERARRKHKGSHFRGKSGANEGGISEYDAPGARLALLCRTIWDRPDLAAKTEFLKITYMTRETAKGDLARAVAAMPNLKYVDLPDGFYSGDPSCLTLRQELQSRCHDIRKMAYRHGAEGALQLLPQGYWRSIEMLELSALVLEPATLRVVLGSLPNLHDLALLEMAWIDDSMFHSLRPQLPDFPAVRTLKLVDTPKITTQGLLQWFQESPAAGQTLTSLTLEKTGIVAQDLHALLPAAHALTHLAITEAVTKSLGLTAQSLPPLQSPTLQILHFEITNGEDILALQKPAESYYAYLAASLHANALPALTTIYVRDPTFTDLLILPPIPAAPFGDGRSSSRSGLALPPPPLLAGPAGSAGLGFQQTLEIFAKGMDESDWVFTSLMPEDNGPLPSPGFPPNSPGRDYRRDSSASVTLNNGGGGGFVVSGGRPLSAYSASRGLGPQWAQGGFGGEARRSVIVGNGFGGFLAVPQEEVPLSQQLQQQQRPSTADGRGGAGAGSWDAMGGGNGGRGKEGRFSFFKPASSSGASPLGTGGGGAGGGGGGQQTYQHHFHQGHERKGSKRDLWR